MLARAFPISTTLDTELHTTKHAHVHEQRVLGADWRLGPEMISFYSDSAENPLATTSAYNSMAAISSLSIAQVAGVRQGESGSMA